MREYGVPHHVVIKNQAIKLVSAFIIFVAVAVVVAVVAFSYFSFVDGSQPNILSHFRCCRPQWCQPTRARRSHAYEFTLALIIRPAKDERALVDIYNIFTYGITVVCEIGTNWALIAFTVLDKFSPSTLTHSENEMVNFNGHNLFIVI